MVLSCGRTKALKYASPEELPHTVRTYICLISPQVLFWNFWRQFRSLNRANLHYTEFASLKRDLDNIVDAVNEAADYSRHPYATSLMRHMLHIFFPHPAQNIISHLQQALHHNNADAIQVSI